MHLTVVDWVVIGVYAAVLIGLGFYLKKFASSSIEDYFIGGRKMPWWALGISGMASWLDVAGTTVIVSFVFLLGPRGFYIALRGGAGLILVMMLVWLGKWHRRTQCITGAEVMIFRFGDGFGGRFAQLASALAAVVSTIGMLTYLTVAAGIFLSRFLPFTPPVCSAMLLGVATIYTMVSGFYGVIFTDIFQAVIILVAVFLVSFLAIFKVLSVDNFAQVALEATGNAKWTSSVPHFHTNMPPGYEEYEALFMFAVFYFLKSIFQGLYAGGDPKYFGARNDRECGTLSFLWTVMLMFRWPLIIGFAILGIFLVNDLFPDKTVLGETEQLIKSYNPDIRKDNWDTQIANIINKSDQYPDDLIAEIQSNFGDDWRRSLRLLSYEGTINAEGILPAVVLFSIPQGFTGLMLVALIAASMSTFDTNVNLGCGYFTRDIYQKHLRPNASTKELIYISWAYIGVVTVSGFLAAQFTENINDIWEWISMGLMGGLMIPNLLRFYWWRLNGVGTAIGLIIGMTGALLQRGYTILIPRLARSYAFFDTEFFTSSVAFLRDPRWQFVTLALIGLIGTLIGTFLSKPTPHESLKNFYLKVRPFGFWGPMKQYLTDEERQKMEREHRNDWIALPFALGFHMTLLMMPMQLIILEFKAFLFTFAIFAVSLVGMYFFWYRNLSEKYVKPQALLSEDEESPTE